jgi:hypothetical protein
LISRYLEIHFACKEKKVLVVFALEIVFRFIIEYSSSRDFGP